MRASSSDFSIAPSFIPYVRNARFSASIAATNSLVIPFKQTAARVLGGTGVKPAAVSAILAIQLPFFLRRIAAGLG
jgi:hypothetical protein